MKTVNSSLVTLYKDIANLTFEDCKKKCRNIGSCCEDFYCEIAIATAKDDYGLVLERTGNKIPLLNSEGQCVAPPHVRSMCSFHSCDINGVGFFKGDMPRTEKYFELRGQIEMLEIEAFEANHGAIADAEI